MPAPAPDITEDFLSARRLGDLVGRTAQQINVALKLAGLQDGEPGAYYFTDKGKQLVKEHFHTNGYGGIAEHVWHVTTWPESVLDKLDLSEAGVAGIRQYLADRRAAQWAAIKAARAASETEFLRKLAAEKAAEAAPDAAGGVRPWVLVGAGVVVGAVVLRKAVPAVRRRWQQRSGAPGQAQGREAPPEA